MTGEAHAVSTVGVSVIIAAHNAAETISETLQSLLKQTFPTWEAVVVNDGSSDSTPEIARRFAERDRRFQLLNRPHERQGPARNAGIALAQYDWLLFLDADDWIAPDHLKLLTQEVNHNHRLDAVHCGSARVSSDGTHIIEDYAPPTGDLFPVLAYRPAFPNHACIIRKSIVESVGGFDSSFQRSEDWDLWQRVARTGAQFGAVRKVLAFYRMRQEADSLDAELLLRDGLRVLSQGHAPDPRVRNPHPDHAKGEFSRDITAQQYYLLSWCAGLLLGAGKDASALLELLESHPFPDLNPDAIAKCIFDAALLPTCRSPQQWEDLAHSTLRSVDEFLLDLESSSRTPSLAQQAGLELKRLILKRSQHWHPIIAVMDRLKLRIEECDLRTRQITQALDERAVRINRLEREISDRENTIKERDARIQKLEAERARWHELALERKQMLKKVRKELWIRIGIRLGLMKMQTGSKEQQKK